MTQEQREALKIVEADILFEANAGSYDEYIDVEGTMMARRPNGDIVAIDTGQYVLGYRYAEDGTLVLTLFTDYGFCKSECSYAEIDPQGNIELY
jgi:hypothetical protein